MLDFGVLNQTSPLFITSGIKIFTTSQQGAVSCLVLLLSICLTHISAAIWIDVYHFSST